MLISEFYVLKIRKTQFFIFCFIFKVYDSIKLRSIDYNTEFFVMAAFTVMEVCSQNYDRQDGSFTKRLLVCLCTSLAHLKIWCLFCWHSPYSISSRK